jgi:hypothetical protein
MSIRRTLAVAGALAAAAGAVQAVRSKRADESVSFPDAGGPPVVETVEVGGRNQPMDEFGED